MNFLKLSLNVLYLALFQKTIKMMGHHARLRDMTGRSYPIYACTSTNHAIYSSVQVIFCGS